MQLQLSDEMVRGFIAGAALIVAMWSWWRGRSAHARIEGLKRRLDALMRHVPPDDGGI